MRKLQHKTKQLFLLLFKVALVSVICWFIYYKIIEHKTFKAELFTSAFNDFQLTWIFSLLLLSAFNWFFEVLKWKTLVNTFQQKSTKEIFRQVLLSHSISILTPNRIGEYGVKSLFFKKEYWKKIVFLNFFGNNSQLLATVIFGVLGLSYLFFQASFQLHFFKIEEFLLALVVLILVSIIIFNTSYFKKKWLQLKKAYQKIQLNIQLKVIGLSVLRYLFFSHQFYFILLLFNVEITYPEAMSCIYAMYFLSSFLPSFFVFDAVVKGGFAIWLFSFFNVEEVPVLLTTLLMWVFNFSLPAILGSVYIFKFEPKLKLNSPLNLW